MSFGFGLKALISKATEEYTTVAKNDPIISSTDDNTSRGDELDFILSQQAAERKALWDKLYNLESRRVENGDNVVIGPPLPADRKELANLMTLDQQIVEKLDTEMSKLDLDDRPDDTILELKYREKLSSQVPQFEDTLEFLKLQLKEVEQATESEKKILEECGAVNVVLLKKEEELTLQLQNKEKSTDKLLAELLVLRKKYDEDLRDMTDFMDEHYPPHVVDGAGPLGDECLLKAIVEQLLNSFYSNPENPYLRLRPGEYWTPYVETLVQAGIAIYHPEDSKLICLENFRLF